MLGGRCTTPSRSASGAVARLLGPNSADVADVVQETMLAAARSARTYDEVSGSLWNWLWGIARLQVALHFRKQKRHDQLKSAGDWLTASAGRLAHWLDGTDPPMRISVSSGNASKTRDLGRRWSRLTQNRIASA